MAVTSVKPVRDKWSAGGWNEKRQRTYSLRFRVECDDHYDGPVTIRTTTNGPGQPSLPLIGNTYYVNATEQDAGAFCNAHSYELESASANPPHATWIVQADFGPTDWSVFGPDPLLWPIRVSFKGQKYERVYYLDRDGRPVLNSARCPFADPLTGDDSRSMLTVVRNEPVSTYDEDLAALYRDSLNADVWNGKAAGTVKCEVIETSDPQYDSNGQVWYYAVTYVFAVDPDGWGTAVLDQGFTYLNGASPRKVVKILDKDGQPPSDAQLLDGFGNLLATNLGPVYLTFNKYKILNFETFNIDLSTRLGA